MYVSLLPLYMLSRSSHDSDSDSALLRPRRISIVAQRLARVALEDSLSYAHKRRVFAKRLVDSEVIRNKVAHMSRVVEAQQAWLEVRSVPLFSPSSSFRPPPSPQPAAPPLCFSRTNPAPADARPLLARSRSSTPRRTSRTTSPTSASAARRPSSRRTAASRSSSSRARPSRSWAASPTRAAASARGSSGSGGTSRGSSSRACVGSLSISLERLLQRPCSSVT